jgi:urease accessory protein
LSRDAGFLAALQLADSALPIGRFVHSHGLEAWLRTHPDATPETLAELVEAFVSESVATLDGVVLAHAHRAASIATLAELDEILTARKLSPSSRDASRACGRQLARLAGGLAGRDVLVAGFAELVARRDTDGNLAVVEGSLARALDLAERDAVLVELRSSAAGLLSAALRLGALSPARAQLMLAKLGPALTRAADTAVSRGLDQLSATAPGLELAALAHARSDARMFVT